jgi:protein TonB
MIPLLDGRVAGITDSPPARVRDDTPASENLPHSHSRIARGGGRCKVAPIAIFLRTSCDDRRQVVMNWIRLPLALSIAGHAVVLALLILFAVATRPSPQPAMPGGFEVVLGQVLPEAKTPPSAQASPSQAAVVRTVKATEPAPTPEPEVPILPPDQTAAVPVPPPRKPVVREQPKNVMRRPERPRAPVAEPTPAPARFAELPRAGSAGAQYPAAQPAAAAVGPSHIPEPDAAASYRAMISAWLESHKRYPESARQRGEEGSAPLRFRIDRSGRVLDYSYASTGYADLDAGLDEMMRGAQLPPFPPGMTASRIEVSLTMQFNLTR